MNKLTLAPVTCNSLIFLDPAVDNYDSFIAGVKPETEVFLLNPTEDGVSQITAALVERTGIKSVHIVSHGNPGAVLLGNTQLSLDTLDRYRSQLQQWRYALTEDADLLLYGCNVAAGERGSAFVERLKSLIGAEIAASTNLTGSAARGGDWDLEVTTGKIKASLAFEPEVMAAYASVLVDTFIDEDFSDANGTTPPPGWTVNVIEGNPTTDAWRFDNPGNRSGFDEPLTDPIAIYDSDFLSDDNVPENIAFESPVFDASDESTVFLKFDQDYRGISGPENASEAFVEVYNGTDWETVYSTVDDADNSQTLDISAQAAGVENAQVRFRFDGDWSFLWAIDNVQVVDTLLPGVRVLNTPKVSEDNVPDPLRFQLILEKPPTADVSIDFSVDETQLQPIAPIIFTPENWNIPQIPLVAAVADGVEEGNEQTSDIGIRLTSADSDYSELAVADVTAEITDNAIPDFISYRTVEGTFRDLEQLADANSNIASWIDIGDSYDKVTPDGPEGYDIYALKLTNKSTDGYEPKPALYVQGSIHAREYTTAELVTRFAEDLVAGYGKNPDYTWLLDYFEVNIVPIVNPDGRKFAEQGYSWRKNTNPNPPTDREPAPFPTYGVDLNRNYDSKWGEIPGGSSGDPASLVYRGTAAFSEPESQSVSNYVLSLFPDQKGPDDSDRAPDDTTGVYLDVHSYGNLVLYPFGWTDDPAPNKKALETLGRKFGYFSGLDGEAYDVDQAVGLYPTDGTTDDWTYDTLGVASYTIEMGFNFFESTEYFENTIVPEFTPALFYAAKSAYRPYQTAAGPDSVDVKVDLTQVTAGTSVILSAIADDTRYDDGIIEDTDQPEPIQSIATARYTIDAPSWVEGVEFYSLSAADGSFDSSVETLEATIDTSDLASGRHTIFVESQDANGNFGVPTAVFIEVLDFPNHAEIFEGTSGSDTLIGNDGSDVIYGYDGNDIVAGGQVDDLLFGGADRDTFVLATGEGTDTIGDFKIEEDSIGLASGITFGQLSITQDGNNTLVSFNNESLAILEGVKANTLIDSAFNAFTVV